MDFKYDSILSKSNQNAYGDEVSEVKKINGLKFYAIVDTFNGNVGSSGIFTSVLVFLAKYIGDCFLYWVCFVGWKCFVRILQGLWIKIVVNRNTKC